MSAECNGLCLWGADIGVPEYPGVAYPHPDCERHGAPLHDESYAHDDYDPDGPPNTFSSDAPSAA